MSNWKKLIEEHMKTNGETFADAVSCTLTDTELVEMFNDDFGSANGKPFTLWTVSRVYFPVNYDGAEWVESVARNPDGVATKHIGGG